MSFYHNMPWSNTSLYNNRQFAVSHATNLNSSHYSNRTSTDTIAYTNNTPIYHPTKPGLFRGSVNQYIGRGTFTTKYYWPTPGNTDITEAISSFKYILNTEERLANSTIVTIDNETANSITVTYNTGHDDYSYRNVKYVWLLNCPKTQTTFSRNATLLCILNINDTIDHYEIKVTDYEKDVERTIKKFDNECYAVFSSNVVTSDSKQLEQFKMYKMTSGDLNITPQANGKVTLFHGQPD